MDELVDRLVAGAGIDRSVAETSIGIIIDFLRKEGPTEKVDALLAGMPGADALLARAGEQAAGGAMAMLGMSGLMGAANRLMAAGLSMGQVQTVTQQFVAFAREKAGEDKVGEIVGAIPGLSQFV